MRDEWLSVSRVHTIQRLPGLIGSDEDVMDLLIAMVKWSVWWYFKPYLVCTNLPASVKFRTSKFSIGLNFPLEHALSVICLIKEVEV